MARKRTASEADIAKMLLDADILKLDKMASYDFNIFAAMGMARAEIRHSYVLKWLLDPANSHNLGTSILKGLMNVVIASMDPNDKKTKTLETEFFRDVTVTREMDNMDICIIGNHFVLCIENKVDSGEHDDQLIRYGKTVEELCGGSKVPVLTLLSPDGREAVNFRKGDNWIPVTYRQIKDIICDAVDDNIEDGGVSDDNVRVFIDEYITLLEREFGDMTEKEIAMQNTVKAFYYKHQAAIDYMMNLIDDKFLMTDFIENWLEKEYKPEYDKTQNDTIILRKKKEKGIVRFTTSKLNSFIPHINNGWWGDESAYYYEIDAKSRDENNGKFMLALRLIFGYSGAELIRPEMDSVEKMICGNCTSNSMQKTLGTVTLSPRSVEDLKNTGKKRQFKAELKTQLDRLLAETQGKL